MASPRPTARISQLSSHLCAPPPPLSASPTDAPYDSEPAPASEWDAELAELRLRLKMAREVPASDPGRVRQAQQGKLMVRDRVAGMLDGGSLVEIGSIAGKGTYDEEGNVRGFTRANYVAGRGTVGGRPVVVGGDDFSVRGGHADGAIWRKAQYTEQMARELRIPLIRLLDGSSGGGSVASILKRWIRICVGRLVDRSGGQSGVGAVQAVETPSEPPPRPACDYILAEDS